MLIKKRQIKNVPFGDRVIVGECKVLYIGCKRRSTAKGVMQIGKRREEERAVILGGGEA